MERKLKSLSFDSYRCHTSFTLIRNTNLYEIVLVLQIPRKNIRAKLRIEMVCSDWKTPAFHQRIITDTIDREEPKYW